MNRVKLYHEIKGKGDPLIMIAGFTADHLAWVPLVDTLSENFQVITFDNRGTGQSPCPDGENTIEDFAHDTIGLMNDLGIEKAHIVGQSMGTVIAQYMAADYPERVNKMVLSNGLIKSDKTSQYTFRLIGHLMEDRAPRERLFEVLLPWCFSNDFLEHQTNVDLIIDLFKNNPYPQTIKGFWLQYNAIYSADTKPLLPRIKAPTLIIACEEDLLTNVKEAQELHEGIKGSKLTTIAHMAHVPHVEKPELIADLIKNFCLN